MASGIQHPGIPALSLGSGVEGAGNPAALDERHERTAFGDCMACLVKQIDRKGLPQPGERLKFPRISFSSGSNPCLLGEFRRCWSPVLPRLITAAEWETHTALEFTWSSVPDPPVPDLGTAGAA